MSFLPSVIFYFNKKDGTEAADDDDSTPAVGDLNVVTWRQCHV